jgi:DNA polymerase
MLAVSDSSQIEARVVAWLAEQDDLVEAFRQGRDVYCEFASEIYGRQITKEDKTERFVGKTCILGLGYGMGHAKFLDTLRTQGGVIIDEDEAQRIVQLYRNKYFKIPELWRKVDKAIRALATGGTGTINGKVHYTEQGFMLPNGMVIRYHGLQNTNEGMMYANSRKVARQLEVDADAIYQGTKIYGGKAVENIVQALARIVITDQMLDIKREHNYPVLFQVHDELIFLVPNVEKDEAEYHLRNILIAMSRPPLWASDIPVACEGSITNSYGSAK